MFSFGNMWIIAKKEWLQFFSSLTGYIALIIFLLLTGLLIFVFPDTSLLDFGYASLTGFFKLAPWVLLFLVPTVTMRSFADEYRSGTFEVLKTSPLSASAIVWGKFIGCWLVIVMALLPTILYAFTLQRLSVTGGIDIGATVGSYAGLFLLSAVFTSIGICVSSFTNNTVIAFIAAAFICFILYTGFEAISKMPALKNGAGYYVEMFGINFHYNNISRGVIDIRDLVYFFGVIYIFSLVTKRNINIR
jgi:ABC-2 type transport system permease protein